MKKILTLGLLILGGTMLLAGCGKDQNKRDQYGCLVNQDYTRNAEMGVCARASEFEDLDQKKAAEVALETITQKPTTGLTISRVLIATPQCTGCYKVILADTENQEITITLENREVTDIQLPLPPEQTGNQQDLSTNEENMCPSAIEEYLAAADMKGNGAVVKKGDNIVVDYIGRLDDKEVFDTSVESVAKACGKYMEGRNYDEGLAFEVGAGQMIKGFDTGVQGMKVGQTKTVTIPAAEAYGEWSEEGLQTVPKDQIPNAAEMKEGMSVYTQAGQTFKVYKITDTDIVFDTNHELAGKDLIFDITVREIK